MPDTPAPITHPPDASHEHSAFAARLAVLEKHHAETVTPGILAARDLGTQLKLVGAGVALVLLFVVNGAINTRDGVASNTARIAALESARAADNAERTQRQADDRSTRDSLIDIRADLRALRAQVAELAQRQTTDDTRAPAAHR